MRKSLLTFFFFFFLCIRVPRIVPIGVSRAGGTAIILHQTYFIARFSC